MGADEAFEPVTLDTLKQDRLYVKLVKKQARDVDAMRKRHAKERAAVQRSQCVVFDKVVAGQEHREKSLQEKLIERATGRRKQ